MTEEKEIICLRCASKDTVPDRNPVGAEQGWRVCLSCDLVFNAAHAPVTPVDRFICPVCGMTSYHPKDVEQGFCGNCHAWTGPAAQP